MVEFCTVCGTSLPKGDLSVKDGSVYTSHDYNCPSCGKTANPSKGGDAEAPEISVDSDLVFKKGDVRSEQ
jgi:ribosomal protein S27E